MGYNTATHETPNKIATTMAISNGSSMKGSDSSIRMERIQASPNYQDRKFVNSISKDVTKDGAV